MATMIWRGARAQKDIEVKVARGLDRLGKRVVKMIKHDMRTTPLAPDTRGVLRSIQGNPPAIQEGDLEESVGYSVTRRGLTVFAKAPYARYLELGFVSKGGKFVRRPFLGPAFERIRGEAARIIAGGL